MIKWYVIILNFSSKDSWTKISDAGTVCLQWRYSKVADKVGHAEDLNHASLVANVIYNIYLSGHHPYINDITEQLANTMFDIVFCTRDDQGRFQGASTVLMRGNIWIVMCVTTICS